ncbi:uncharacterized protein BJX67DRAFT_391560 [Aspergillus lucknowensis]|uniref:BTB domain-containing protein n=1 Tax=Aspergillus lucknowensis TaxID=176173 RepID=A0ABR4L9J6_9EURO
MFSKTPPVRESSQMATDGPSYELDRDGDVLFIVRNAPNDLPPDLKDVQSDALAGNLSTSIESAEAERQILRLRASSKHLTLACPYFVRMFRSGLREATELKTKGNVEIEIEDSRGTAFLLLMLIIHCRTSQVPLAVTLTTLADVAVLVDFYECYDAVATFPEEPIDRDDSDATRWLLISWVFRRNSIFTDMTQWLQLLGQDTIEATGLPIPGLIIDKLNAERITYIQRLFDDLHRLEVKLRKGCPRDSNSTLKKPGLCTFAVLGGFTKHMADMELSSPTPTAPFSGFSAQNLLADLRRKMDSPVIRDPDSSGSYINHDSCRLSSRVTALLKSYSLPAGFDLDSPEFASLRAGR